MLLLLVDFDYSNALVEATVLAHLMGRFDCATVRAGTHCGHLKLPYCGTTGIASCFGCFSLRNSHVGTSLHELRGFQNPPYASVMMYHLTKAQAYLTMHRHICTTAVYDVTLSLLAAAGMRITVYATMRTYAEAIFTAQDL